jgi:hypothetical protein
MHRSHILRLAEQDTPVAEPPNGTRSARPGILGNQRTRFALPECEKVWSHDEAALLVFATSLFLPYRAGFSTDAAAV